jgi:hypothetical protein
VHIIGSSMMISAQQRFVELQAAIEAFMPSPDACLEICVLIIQRIWQRQLDMILRLSLGSIHPVCDYLLSSTCWYLSPQALFNVNCSLMHSGPVRSASSYGFTFIDVDGDLVFQHPMIELV